ncbi:VOC family protein [Streptomyces parvus]|uniref:VOC family protein n=1 Tax=Streptomyces parvus TaxID=66428 RepID=UPI00382DB514
MASTKEFQVTFDCAEPERVARFWCEVLGYVAPPPGEFRGRSDTVINWLLTGAWRGARLFSSAATEHEVTSAPAGRRTTRATRRRRRQADERTRRRAVMAAGIAVVAVTGGAFSLNAGRDRGDGPGERVTAAGYPWSTYGENIARGQSAPEQARSRG